MVVGLITGAIEGNLRIEVRGQFPLLMPPRTMAIFGPMYSISTDSISMKTNGSDFEDGVRSMVRCDVCVCVGRKEREDRNKSQKTVKIEITSGSL